MTSKSENLLTEANKLFWLRRELSRFSNKRKRKIRAGSREKNAFGVFWLTQKIYIENYSGQKISEHKSWEKCLQEAEDRLGENGKHTLSSFLKHKRVNSGLFSMPEVYQQYLQLEKIEQQVIRLRNLPIQYVESANNDEELATLNKENRLIRRVMMQFHRSSEFTQRELCRRLGTTLPTLLPVLEVLERAHFIVWDRNNRTISTDAWNPQDDRLFLWLADSSFPWLGPKLVKGKIHRCCEYNSRAIEEWIRTGAAGLCDKQS